jgi:hypothetical protein
MWRGFLHVTVAFAKYVYAHWTVLMLRWLLVYQAAIGLLHTGWLAS